MLFVIGSTFIVIIAVGSVSVFAENNHMIGENNRIIAVKLSELLTLERKLIEDISQFSLLKISKAQP